MMHYRLEVGKHGATLCVHRPAFALIQASSEALISLCGMKRSLFMVRGNFLPINKKLIAFIYFFFCVQWHTSPSASRKPATTTSPCLKEGCPKKDSVFHLMSFRITILGNAAFPLPPSPLGSVISCQSCKRRYGSAFTYAQNHEQLLQCPNKHSTNVSRNEKFETTSSCGPEVCST